MPRVRQHVLLAAACIAAALGGCAEEQGPGERPRSEAETETPRPSVQPAAQKRVDEAVSAYLRMQEALAKDDAAAASAGVPAVRSAADALATEAEGTLRDGAKKVAAAVPKEGLALAEMREAFKPLSAAMIDLVHVAPPSTSVAVSVQVVHCPMAKAKWLQAGGAVSNPYMPSDMRTCGTVEETVSASR